MYLFNRIFFYDYLFPYFGQNFNQMREALFIKKNKDRWEKMAYMPEEDIDEMAGEFTQLVDDLGYSKTFYPTSKTTTFLNTEASKRYLTIYQNRKEEQNRVITFYKTELPLTIAKHHKTLLSCFLLFMLFYAIGFYSAIKDESIISDILGSDYIRMTEKNIEQGNPFGVYQRDNNVLMFLGIMVNNIHVAFTDFLEGLIFPFLTIKSLLNFGVMVGGFHVMFFKHGMGLSFILAVMIHGTLEIYSFIMAAAAGMVLGKSWLFPGSLTRLAAFKQGAKGGLKIIIGAVMPVLVMAAMFEGLVTRYYNTMPVWLNVLILLISLAFIVSYFVVYPFVVKRKVKNNFE